MIYNKKHNSNNSNFSLNGKDIKYKPRKPMTSVTDLEILVVLVTRLLRQDLNRLVNGMELVELWDKG
jgi:hypothetical protein